MGRYWARQRLLLSLVLAVVIATAAGLLFVVPYIQQKASAYNSQSIYKNSDIDFIAPEPSFDQVTDLPGTEGIDKMFPFYLTKTEVTVNGKSRTTTVLLSDQFQNIGMTMYGEKRLIEKSNESVSNPILVDWQFIQETAARIGDTVSFSLGESSVDYTISAIYETNTIYDGGAIIAEISSDQKTAIAANAKSNGYSGMYIAASDYGLCRNYLTNDYRPLGRLKDHDQFENDEQYKVHYDAIMSSGYANEITDFRVREAETDSEQNFIIIIIGGILAAVLIVAFNIILSNRGCEKGYFRKHCIPKGQNVKSYYIISFFFEMIASIALFILMLIMRTKMTQEYVPSDVYGVWLVIIPLFIIVAELVSLGSNFSKVAVTTAKVKTEQEAKAKAKAEAEAKKSETNGSKEVKTYGAKKEES